LAVVYVPMIAYIAFELRRAPLVDDDGNIVSVSMTNHYHRRTRLTPAE
jgi:hypothetical protein